MSDNKGKVFGLISAILIVVGFILAFSAKIYIKNHWGDLKESAAFMGQSLNIVMIGSIIGLCSCLFGLFLVESEKKLPILHVALCLLVVFGAVCNFLWEKTDLYATTKIAASNNDEIFCTQCIITGIMYIVGAIMMFVSMLLTDGGGYSPNYHYPRVRKVKTYNEYVPPSNNSDQYVHSEPKPKPVSETKPVQKEEKKDVDNIKKEEVPPTPVEEETIELQISEVSINGSMLRIGRNYYGAKYLKNLKLNNGSISFTLQEKDYAILFTDQSAGEALYSALIQRAK